MPSTIKRLLLLSLILSSGCAVKEYKFIRYEQVGPYTTEIWQHKKTKKCERRTFIGWYYYNPEVSCKGESK